MWKNDICIGYFKYLKIVSYNAHVFDHSPLYRSGNSVLDSAFNQAFHANFNMAHANLYQLHHRLFNCD